MPPSQPTPSSLRFAVCSDPARDALLRERSRDLARQLDLPWEQDAQQHHRYDLVLALTPQGLGLRVTTPGSDLAGGRDVRIDLAKIDTTSNAGASFRQPIARAVGLGRRIDYERGAAMPVILDATAGFGEDAWILASLGCQVTAIERHPVVAALLADSLARVRESVDGHAVAAANRITLRNADACQYLAELAAVDSPATVTRDATDRDPAPAPPHRVRPDIVYLDPMFPAKRKAAQRKPMRVLRWLAGEDVDADQLLPLARRVAASRVVVKRPAHAPPLAQAPPAATHQGKGVRWDIYPADARCR